MKRKLLYLFIALIMLAGFLPGAIPNNSPDSVLAAAASTWSTKTSMYAPRTGSAAVIINGILYVAGGYYQWGEGETPTLQAYDPTTDNWSALASMPLGRWGGDGAGVIDGKLYVAGGMDYTSTLVRIPHSELFVYDPTTDSWSSKAPMPTPSGGGATGVINGKLYVTTAVTDSSSYGGKLLHVYDPATDSWSQLQSSPYAHCNPAFGVIDNKLYVAGGWDGSATSSTLDVFDPATNTWTTKTPMPTAGLWFSSEVFNGKLYVIGGGDNVANVYYNLVYVYDPVTDTWTGETSMPTARASAATGFINSILYVSGGNDNSGTLATVEALTLTVQSPLTLTTGTATNITASSAHLTGNLTSLGTAATTNVSFQWGLSSGNYTFETSPVTMNTTGVFSTNLTGLSANTTYHFQAKAAGDGVGFGGDMAFTTLSTPTGGSISGQVYQSDNITPITGARIEVFEFNSISGLYWIPQGDVLTSENGTYLVTGLPTLQYGVRIKAGGYATQWYTGVNYKDQATPVSVTAQNGAANIDFNLSPGGYISGTAFQSDNITPIASLSIHAFNAVTGQWMDSTDTNASGNYTINGLPPDNYKLKTNASYSGLNYIDKWYNNKPSQDVADTVTVAPQNNTLNINFSLDAQVLAQPPTVTTGTATNITASSAILSGNLTSLGTAPTGNVSFQWGLSSGNYTSETTPMPMNVTGPFSANLTGLSYNTTYYFIAKAVADSVGYGSELTFTTAPMETPPPFLFKWGTSGSGDGQFNGPYGVVVDASGNVYMSDNGNYRIQKFTSSGQFVTKWGDWGTADGQFKDPRSLAVDSSGNLYVADTGNNRIQKFTSSGQFITKWGSLGNGDGQTNRPKGIAIDSEGNVYVAEDGNYRVEKFTSSGEFITKWGSAGSGDGQFNGMEAVAVDSSGNVYVSDYSNHRIQKFTGSGEFIMEWGSNGSGDDQFSYIYGLATDASGHLYVADTMNHRIQKFNGSGQFLTKWGTLGAGEGQFHYPIQIAVDASGRVYVADQNNNRIQVFGYTLPATPTKVTTGTAANITDSSAILSGNLTSLGSTTSANVSFQLGTVSGNYTLETAPVTMNTTGIFNALLGLSANTTYYFRAKAVGDGTDYGAEVSFTTNSILPGDANGDGLVNSLDITKLERIIIGLDAPTSGADANRDGHINAIDITKIERLIAEAWLA